MRLSRSSTRRRWATGGAISLLLLGLVAVLGIPERRGCGEGAQCPPLVESPVRGAAAPSTPPHLVYLNRGGATIAGGSDDAAHDTSSVVAGFGRSSATLPPAALDDQAFGEVQACLGREFARFNLAFTDQRPPQPGYLMVVFGGSGSELGLGADSRGDAPFDKESCNTVENAVAFVFSDKLGGDAAENCEVAAHEIAHVFSVDHELLAADAMSHLAFTGHRSFQDLDAPCGESQERPCPCGRASQNPVQILLDKLGPAPSLDVTPPTITADAGLPRPGFAEVTVHASDPSGIASVALTYRDGGSFLNTTCGDGLVPCITDGATYTFTIGGARGHARYRATAIDSYGNPATTPPADRTIDDTPPDASPMTLTVDGNLAAGIATTHANVANAAGATLYWTDGRGVTQQRALCQGGAGDWSRSVQVASPGARSFVVVATDADGHTAISPEITVGN
jgi:hypothetical protein